MEVIRVVMVGVVEEVMMEEVAEVVAAKVEAD